jgi:hypothetical protein
MRDAFNLVRGAVSKKDLVPVLTHFAVHQGRIHGYNGRIHISAPCEELAPLPSFTVPANLLLAAIDACTGEPVLTIDDSKTLTFDRVEVTDTDSHFTATLPVGHIDQFPIPEAPPKAKKIKGQLLNVLRLLQPFIGEDASRLWCASIKFQGTLAFATNNVALAMAPLPQGIPLIVCALPVYAVEELLRMELEPLGMAFEEDHALWFLLPGGVWVRTSLVADQWPDAKKVLEAAQAGAQYQHLDPALAHAVQQVAPFCPDPKLPAIVFKDTHVTTQEGQSSASVGGFAGLAGTYHATPLLTVLGAAVEVAWAKAPRVPWRGENGIEGVLLGLGGG